MLEIKKNSTNGSKNTKESQSKLKIDKMQSPDFQFYISRYPFPQNSIKTHTKLYKTSYESEGEQLKNKKLSQITSLNQLNAIIKLKQIVRNFIKPNSEIAKFNTGTQTYSYSLYYEIIPHFILSTIGMSITKYLNEKKILRTSFQQIFQVIQELIKRKVFYLLDVQNIGLTINGKIKVYVPANLIIEENIFTDVKQIQMKATANAVIQCLIKTIQNYNSVNNPIDLEIFKHEIKKQMHKIEIKSKNIESQIFTFNQNAESHQEQCEKFNQNNEDLQKTVKIRKSSQKISFVPAIDFINIKLSPPKAQSKYQRCVTSRTNIHESNDLFSRQRNQDRKMTQTFHGNHPKQNEFLKQKMKDYEQKLFLLNNTVKQMKQQFLFFSKKQKKSIKVEINKNDQNVLQNKRQRSKTFKNINSQTNEQIDIMAQKLSTSRLQIKDLLNSENNLRYSYNVEQHIPLEGFYQRQQQSNDNLLGNFIENQDIQKQLQALINEDGYNDQVIEKQTKVGCFSKQNKRYPIIDRQQRREKISDQKSSKNRKSPNSYDYQSSFSKYSPPGGNPFRQYRNLRIEYVINEQNKLEDQAQKNLPQNAFIQVHPEPQIQPYRIVRKPINKKQLCYPILQARQPFRYSCLAIPKESGGQFQYIAIPENLYDPTQYDSVDTFQMELGREYIMPKIVSKNAYRHTLFPTNFLGQMKRPNYNQNSSKQKDQSNSGSAKREIRQNKIDRRLSSQFLTQSNTNKKSKHKSYCLRDNLSQKNLSRIPQIIKEVPDVAHQQSMDTQIFSPNKQEHNRQKAKNIALHKLQINPSKIQIQKNNSFQHQEKSELSKTSKDVSRILKKVLQQDKLSQKGNQNCIKQNHFLKPFFEQTKKKQAINKQKIKALLNKSKQIISKYKNNAAKKQA